MTLGERKRARGERGCYGFTAGEAGERGRAASTRKSRRGEGVSEDDGAECEWVTTTWRRSVRRRTAATVLAGGEWRGERQQGGSGAPETRSR